MFSRSDQNPLFMRLREWGAMMVYLPEGRERC